MMGYTRFPLFRGISEESVDRMFICFRMRQAEYKNGELICEYDGSGREVGIVTEGSAQLVRIDYSGTRTILEHMKEGALFGEVLCFTNTSGDSISVVSEGCKVLYIDYSHIMKRCESACQHHSQLVQNMFELTTEQIQQLSRRVEVLSRRSIRDKLLCYFSMQAAESGESSFTMPFTLSALAEYISTDRSAMMRELRKLREDGLVRIEGKKVTVCS